MTTEVRPELPEGYLGAQPKFGELGMSTGSHDDPEIEIKDNKVEITMKYTKPVKITQQLINTRTEADLADYVFVQTNSADQTISLVVHMPESDYYKLQIFALPIADESKSLPNVYNYLIHCARVNNPVYPFPKQYAQWKEGCYIKEPVVLNSHSKLTNIKWKVKIPNAKNVAVVADGEWHHFDNKGDSNWEAGFSLDKLRGKDAKVTLNANFGDDESKYSTLLEYKI